MGRPRIDLGEDLPVEIRSVPAIGLSGDMREGCFFRGWDQGRETFREVHLARWIPLWNRSKGF